MKNTAYRSKTTLTVMLLLPAMVFFAACGAKKDNCCNALRSGDLLFVGLADCERSDGSMANAIVSATGDDTVNFFHVAVVDIDSAGTWVIDAGTERGVDRRPLDTFLADIKLDDGSMPIVEAMRLCDSAGVHLFVATARSLVGMPYDLAFLPANGALYCSELVRDSYVRRPCDTLFEAKPMNFLSPDGTCDAYWQRLFDSLGMAVPQGMPGTNPNDMHKSSILKRVCSPLITEHKTR